MDFIPTQVDILIIFVKVCTFFQKKLVFLEEGGIKYDHKTDTEKGGGVWQMLTKLTEGGGGLGKC